MGRRRKLWSCKVGAPGLRVTAYERRHEGALYLRWWVPGMNGTGGRWAYRALKHTNREAAAQAAKDVAAQLLTATLASATGTATLAEVLAAYEADVSAHTKGEGPTNGKRRAAIWTAFFGASREVHTIDHPTLDRFVRERKAGTITAGEYELAKAPSDRTIGSDLEYLRAALNHACRVVRPNGTKLLTLNPLGTGKAGYQVPRTKQPRRPIVTYDRYLALVAKADQVDPQKLFGGFMALVEGLGWRVSALCALRACDVDVSASPAAPHGRIYKRADADKQGMSGWVPMSQSVRAGVDRIRAAKPAIGEAPLFPAPRAVVDAPQGEMPKAWTRHHAAALLERAEKAAKLDAVQGGQFHPYRRKWATERKHLPDADVAAAGAWGDTRALKANYQQVDELTMLAVVSEPTKLRDAKAAQAETA
jgi:hypothetical protein